jgi:hypothetical protein
MEMKKCSKCNKAKKLTDFYKRRTGKRTGDYYEKCKECMKARGREYYHKNRVRQLGLALIRKRKSYYLRRKIVNKLKNKPCSDCGIKYPYYVMDFDHKDKNTKLGNPSHLLSYSLERFLVEIEKCDIVCANCHRIRTFKKFNKEKLMPS